MNYKTGDFSCSEAYHKYAGSLYSYREMLSNTGDRQLVHEEDQKLLEKFFADTESGAPYAESVLRVRMTDGSFRWTKMAGTFIKDESGSRCASSAPLRTLTTRCARKRASTKFPTGCGR